MLNMHVHVYWYDMHYVISAIWQLLDFSYLLCLCTKCRSSGTQATLCQPRVSVPNLPTHGQQQQGWDHSQKYKESGGFHLEVYVSHRLRHSLLQVVLIVYISTKNSSMMYMYMIYNMHVHKLNYAERTLVL